jgi:hypothetical protein
MKLNQRARYDIEQALAAAQVGPRDYMPLSKRWYPCPEHPRCFVTDDVIEEDEMLPEYSYTPEETD